jgi:hypothetical protein
MKITLATLKLPNPSETLTQMINDYISRFGYLDYYRGKPNEFYNNSYDIAVHLNKRPNELPAEIVAQVKSEYQGFLHNHYISAQIGSIKHEGETLNSCEPPSCTRYERFTISFFFTTGGDDVPTVFYNHYSPNRDGNALDLKYSEVTEVCRVKLSNNTWYCYPTDWAHSIENITDTRNFLIIRFDPLDSTYSMETFMNDYSELIDEIVIDKEMVTNDNGVIVAQN